MKEWMAKHQEDLATSAANGAPWPFVAGVFREFCKLLSGTGTNQVEVPYQAFMMWIQIHNIDGNSPPPKGVVMQAVTEGL